MPLKLTYRPRPRGAFVTASGGRARARSSSAVGWSDSVYSRAGPLFDELPLDGGWLSSAYASRLGEVEDRRSFWPGEFPTSYEPARRLSGASARLRATPLYAPRQKSIGGTFPGLLEPSFGVSFDRPKSVLVCVRRNTRRQVLLAMGHGGGRHRPPRFNEYSQVRC